MTRTIPFFATRSDLSTLVLKVARQGPLCFVRAGLFDSPDIGIVDVNDVEPAQNYLVITRTSLVSVRKVVQSTGTAKFAIDQLENPATIALRPGGLIDQCLLAGQLGTVRKEDESCQLFSRFSSAIREDFKKIKSYYVGKEAESLLDHGFRLTGNLRGPPKYDLRRS